MPVGRPTTLVRIPTDLLEELRGRAGAVGANWLDVLEQMLAESPDVDALDRAGWEARVRGVLAELERVVGERP